MDSEFDFIKIPGYKYATICDSEEILPKSFRNIYHGTSDVSATDCESFGGLPTKGRDIDLVRHVEPPPNRIEQSAFIGTVQFP